MTISLYSKRFLNPFTGMVQIIETPNVRAMSSDGINWRLQIRTAIFKMPWRDLAVAHEVDQYFVYGVWSQQQDLVKVPIHPTLYEEHVEEDAAALIQILKQHLHEIPFPARDDLELWLLDPNDMLPVALVASAILQDDLDFPAKLHWLPCQHDDISFTATAYLQKQQMAMIPVPARDLVSDMVKQRVSNRPSAAWIKRYPDGQGQLLQYHHTQTSRTSAHKESMPLPALPLTSQWMEMEQQQLVRDYFAWLSPVLLTLPTLDSDTRDRMENFAQQYPLSVYQYHRLYPSVCNRALMNKVLVEARLRGAGQ